MMRALLGPARIPDDCTFTSSASVRPASLTTSSPAGFTRPTRWATARIWARSLLMAVSEDPGLLKRGHEGPDAFQSGRGLPDRINLGVKAGQVMNALQE